jgi:hypothetical protein
MFIYDELLYTHETNAEGMGQWYEGMGQWDEGMGQWERL